jgi:hypothetical protein
MLVVFTPFLFLHHKITAGSQTPPPSSTLSNQNQKTQIVKFCRRLLPVADAYDGDKFFTDVADPAAPGGVRRFATPLLLALAVCEISGARLLFAAVAVVLLCFVAVF